MKSIFINSKFFILFSLCILLTYNHLLAQENNNEPDYSTKLQKILQRFRDKKASRLLEAPKYNIKLPSQNENLSTAKLNKAVHNPRQIDKAYSLSNNLIVQAEQKPKYNGNNQITYEIDNQSITKLTEILAKMTARRAKRYDEAKKYNLILPSQGGEFPKMFPKLKELNKYIGSLLSNKYIPENEKVSFGFYP